MVRKTDIHSRVAAVTYDGLCTFEFGIATEVFALPRPEFDFPWYEFVTVAAESRTVRAAGGVRVEAEAGPGALAQADTIVLPGWRDRAERPPQDLLDALREAHARGARLFSICSGVFVLAATGLLDGRRATTHWHHTQALRRMYPAVDVVEDVLYVDDNRIVTSAGSAAGIDAALHIVRQDFGSGVANRVARRLVMAPHRDGGQAQYVVPEAPRAGRSLAEVMDWARARLAQPMDIATLAAQAGMSPRTLQRRFRAETGTGPMAWLQRERLFRAQELLETTDAPLGEVAALSGYESPDTFRIAFKRRVGVSPAAYRARFYASPS